MARLQGTKLASPHISLVPVFYPTRRFGVTYLLGSAADDHGVDVLVSFGFVPLRCAAARVNYVFDVLFESHPHFFTTIERLYFKGVLASCRRAQRIIALSQATRDALVLKGYATSDVIDVVYPGAEFPPVVESPEVLKVPSPYFLYVGRLTTRKNIQTLLRASRRVLQHADAHLVIAGDEDGRVPDLTPPPEIRERVHFLGHVPDEYLPQLYASALALVYVPFAEGFGLPIIEAMGYGVPVIGSSGPGVAEAIGQAGLVVNPTAEVEIANAMLRVATDAPFRVALGARGREWAATFTWERAAQGVLRACETVMATRERGVR